MRFAFGWFETSNLLGVRALNTTSAKMTLAQFVACASLRENVGCFVLRVDSWHVLCDTITGQPCLTETGDSTTTTPAGSVEPTTAMPRLRCGAQ
jgi:hypothetical protein